MTDAGSATNLTTATGDSPEGLLDHRPWPLPDKPWIMAQSWVRLLFAHWPLRPADVAERLPPRLRAFLDTYEGQAWVGVVPFELVDARPRAMPALPWLSSFPELNVRTYLTIDDKPGVYFFSLDAGRLLAVLGARRFYRLPYYHARMRVRSRGDQVDYRSRRLSPATPPAELFAHYRPTGPAESPSRDSLADWLTARYALYTVDPAGNILIGEIAHRPWPLQPAEAELAINTMAAAHAITLPDILPLLHYVERMDMVAWWPNRLRPPTRQV